MKKLLDPLNKKVEHTSNTLKNRSDLKASVAQGSAYAVSRYKKAIEKLAEYDRQR